MLCLGGVRVRGGHYARIAARSSRGFWFDFFLFFDKVDLTLLLILLLLFFSKFWLGYSITEVVISLQIECIV